jgi:hypothetical protein
MCKAFESWVNMTHTQKRLAVVLDRISARFAHRLLYKAFDGWRTRAAESRRLTRIADRVVRNLARGLVGPAWRRWCQYAAERTRHHQLLVVAATRLVNRRLSAAFDDWVQKLHRVRTILRILTRQSNLSLARALRHWHEFMQAEVYRHAVIHAYQSGVRASPFALEGAIGKPDGGATGVLE